MSPKLVVIWWTSLSIRSLWILARWHYTWCQYLTFPADLKYRSLNHISRMICSLSLLFFFWERNISCFCSLNSDYRVHTLFSPEHLHDLGSTRNIFLRDKSFKVVAIHLWKRKNLSHGARTLWQNKESFCGTFPLLCSEKSLLCVKTPSSLSTSWVASVSQQTFFIVPRYHE